MGRERLIIEALERMFGRTAKVIISDGKITKWADDETQPTMQEIDRVIQEMLLEKPINLLREERDNKLLECDWRMAPDYPKSDQPAWIEYRTQLRNLPSEIKVGNIPMPLISEAGTLSFNHWPSKPNS